MQTRRRRVFLIGCLILPLGLCLTCYGVNVLTFLFPYLEASNRWEATQPQAYTASVEYGTLLGLDVTGEEVVRDGVLVSSSRAIYDDPAIDRLFDQARACMLNPFQVGLLWCRVDYDPMYGYPRRVFIDDWDLGRITEIVEFRPE